MSDRLEDFIKANRDALDDLKTPDRVWGRVEAKITPTVRIWKWTAIAASALLLIAVGYIAGQKMYTRPALAGWDEYKEAEQFYQVRIHQKMEEIKAFPVSDEVMQDLAALDAVYLDLHRQLQDDPNANTEILLSVMIRHQRHKLRMMEKILERVDQYEQTENEQHEM